MPQKTIINTDKAPKAIGPYSQAVVYNGIIYTSGQIPLHPESGEVVGSDITSQAEQSLINLKAVIEAANSNLEQVLKVTAYLSSMDDFPAFNEVYRKYFTDDFPARSCFAVKTLPKNVLVEIEAVAYV